LIRDTNRQFYGLSLHWLWRAFAALHTQQVDAQVSWDLHLSIVTLVISINAFEEEQIDNDDETTALCTPKIPYQNILTQPSTPLKNTQKSVKSILQNKIQVSNVSTKKLVVRL
jgi:hypothetical protein